LLTETCSISSLITRSINVTVHDSKSLCLTDNVRVRLDEPHEISMCHVPSYINITCRKVTPTHVALQPQTEINFHFPSSYSRVFSSANAENSSAANVFRCAAKVVEEDFNDRPPPPHTWPWSE
jgi:hypothetical protein